MADVIDKVCDESESHGEHWWFGFNKDDERQAYFCKGK